MVRVSPASVCQCIWLMRGQYGVGVGMGVGGGGIVGWVKNRGQEKPRNLFTAVILLENDQ